MNCLQFFIFTRFFAVGGTITTQNPLLWIAYNFLSLQGSLQLLGERKEPTERCELLTIFYLYKVLCSKPTDWTVWAVVVNCLQFFIFTRFFAVKTNSGFCAIRCELLTIFYLYKVLCSSDGLIDADGLVVNCLQFFIFTRFFAVGLIAVAQGVTLWIAYNFLSLQGSLQSKLNSPKVGASCELLTIFYLYKVLCSICKWHITQR